MGFLIFGFPIFYQRHVEESFISDDFLFRHHYSISINSSKRLQSYDRRDYRKFVLKENFWI